MNTIRIVRVIDMEPFLGPGFPPLYEYEPGCWGDAVPEPSALVPKVRVAAGIAGNSPR